MLENVIRLFPLIFQNQFDYQIHSIPRFLPKGIAIPQSVLKHPSILKTRRFPGNNNLRIKKSEIVQAF